MFVVFVSTCVTVTLHINFVSFAVILKIPWEAFRILRTGLSDLSIDQSNCVFYCSYYIKSFPRTTVVELHVRLILVQISFL